MGPAPKQSNMRVWRGGGGGGGNTVHCKCMQHPTRTKIDITAENPPTESIARQSNGRGV